MRLSYFEKSTVFEVSTEFVPFLWFKCFGCLQLSKYIMLVHKKNFVWNFKNMTVPKCSILIHIYKYKHMLENVFWSNIVPFRNHLFYKAEHTGRSCLNQVWVITFDHSALTT